MSHVIENRGARISHIALYWSDDIEFWQLLAVADSRAEINERVDYWRGKGTENIKVFSAYPLEED